MDSKNFRFETDSLTGVPNGLYIEAARD